MYDHPIHPLADLYPLVSDEELAVLAHNIKTTGQEHPIILDTQGRVVDGRNRLAACKLAKVEPVSETDETLGDDSTIAEYIRKVNNTRRHLTAGQQIAAEALMMHAQGFRVRRPNGKLGWKYGSLPKSMERRAGSGYSQRMTEAGIILDVLGPEGLQRVLRGAAALDAVLVEAKRVANNRDPESPTETPDLPDPENHPKPEIPAETPEPDISPDDREPGEDTLDRAEKRIKRRLRQNAEDLALIRQREWWKPYPSFWAYCEKHLGLTRQQVEEALDAAA